MLEDEWVDIVKYMYNADDAAMLIQRIREIARLGWEPEGRWSSLVTSERSSSNSCGSAKEAFSNALYTKQ